MCFCDVFEDFEGFDQRLFCGRLEHVNSLNLGRASDLELQAMNAFERSQRRIQEVGLRCLFMPLSGL